jgi:hypothetical protein
MDRERIERCLKQVGAYRASGLKAKVWAQANEVDLGTLGSWCAHAARWQKRLGGVDAPASLAPTRGGFIPARVAPDRAAQSLVRIELNVGASRLDLHWPLTHTVELATLLREFSR